MCGGFHCSKISLQLLNVTYLLVAVLLIGISAYAKASAVITSFEIAGGIIASGLFLLLISFLGIFAAIKHHQVLLFFYIVILFLLFIIQFCVSIACLSVTEEQVNTAIKTQWNIEQNRSSYSTILKNAESNFHCCGWDFKSVNSSENAHTNYNLCLTNNGCFPPLQTANSTTMSPIHNICSYCSDVVPAVSSSVLETTGGIGLFFSFTEMLGVWLAVRFRNQKDPKANPNQFL